MVRDYRSSIRTHILTVNTLGFEPAGSHGGVYGGSRGGGRGGAVYAARGGSRAGMYVLNSTMLVLRLGKELAVANDIWIA
jgi:hypothetical protein